ncbi:hypothetical protein EDB86DRAFT_2826719 [Lactarius hatsudake]|nr:hypothetical protein EDB86DRAFT_2826719 [Lactarius hatsudake]
MSQKRRSKWCCVENRLESEEMVETVNNDSDMGHANKIEEVDDGSGEKDDGLNDHQCRADLEEVHTKKDLMLDLLTIMTDKVTVKFKIAPNEYVTEKGWWCNICNGGGGGSDDMAMTLGHDGSRGHWQQPCGGNTSSSI